MMRNTAQRRGQRKDWPFIERGILNRPAEYKAAARCAPERRTPLGSFLAAARFAVACRRARVRQGQAIGGAEEAPSLTATARDGSGMMLVAAGESLRRDRTREMVQRKKVECAAQ